MAASEKLKQFLLKEKKLGNLKPELQRMTDEELLDWIENELKKDAREKPQKN